MLIGNGYKIESDEMNITLFQKKLITGTGRGRPSIKAVGEPYWIPLAYFSSPKEALNYIVNREICITGMKELETVVAKQDELYKLISTLNIGR
jgi:hypothetical protein